jgi:hypothetical protein
MINKLKKFAALAWREKCIFIRAWLLLGWMRAAILATSFKRLAAALDHQRETVRPAGISAEQQQQALRIGQLVAAAAGCTPWQSLCLVQVLVAQRLLVARSIPGQFYLGVRRGCERTADPAGLAGHAWLQCGDAIVSGAAGHEQFTVVSTFRWGSQPA